MGIIEGDTSYSTAEYDTPEDAAAAASGIFNPYSIEQDREVGGGIIRQPNGKYRYTYTLGNQRQGTVSMRIGKRPDEELVAMWHTHGAQGSFRQYFSPRDLQTATETGVPMYMTDHNGALRYVKPGTRKQFVYDKHNKTYGHEGTPVLNADGRPRIVRTRRSDTIEPRRNRQIVAAPPRRRVTSPITGK